MTKRIFGIGLLALVLIFGMAFTGCKNSTGGPPDDPPREVTAKYRFSDGLWYTPPNTIVNNALATLSATSFTVTGGGVNISYTDVYTTGGGSGNEYGETFDWEYLYDSSGKIGTVQSFNNVDMRVVNLGKDLNDGLISYFPNLDTNGMQNTLNRIASHP
jgi:hypothetical protein